jgi:hypothetical protein
MGSGACHTQAFDPLLALRGKSARLGPVVQHVS